LKRAEDARTPNRPAEITTSAPAPESAIATSPVRGNGLVPRGNFSACARSSHANKSMRPASARGHDRDGAVRCRWWRRQPTTRHDRSALRSRPGSHTLLFRQPDISVMSDQAHCFVPTTSREVSMAKDTEAGVYRIVDVVGVSTESWEDAAKRAVETA